MNDTESRKNDLYADLKKSRFLPIDHSIFRKMDEYEAYLTPDDLDGRAELLFLRGEAYFRLGDYEKTPELLAKSIHIPKSYHAARTDSSSYNLLGLMYAFLGQESMALEHFLTSADICRQHGFYEDAAISYINTGWLYRDLDDYDQALRYYEKALDSISHIAAQNEVYHIRLVCNSYLGQLYCLMKQFDKALTILDQVEADFERNESAFYSLSFDTFCYRIYDYLGNSKKTDYFWNHLLNYAKSDCDFLEYFEFYYDIGCYLLDRSKPEPALQLLHYMDQNCKKLSLIFTNLKFQQLKVRYSQSYGTSAEYLQACHKYMELSLQYEEYSKISKLRGIAQLKQLRLAQRQKKQYQEKSQHDPLTNLLNKYTFKFLCKQYLKKVTVSYNNIMAIIDLDQFKSINDTYGHLMGDQVIKNAASLLQTQVDKPHLCGRAGGDEFILFFRALPLDQVLRILKAFQNDLAGLRYEDCSALKLTVSIGVAYQTYSLSSYEDLFTCADQALYHAKTHGRNQIAIGNPVAIS